MMNSQPLPPASAFCLYEFVYLRYLRAIIWYLSLVSVFFHLAYHFQGLPMLQHILSFHSFLKPSNIPSYALFIYFFHLLMDMSHCNFWLFFFLLRESFLYFYNLYIWFSLRNPDQSFSSVLSLFDMDTMLYQWKASHREVKSCVEWASALPRHSFFCWYAHFHLLHACTLHTHTLCWCLVKGVLGSILYLKKEHIFHWIL